MWLLNPLNAKIQISVLIVDMSGLIAPLAWWEMANQTY
jgi:hypothetical protein